MSKRTAILFEPRRMAPRHTVTALTMTTTLYYAGSRVHSVTHAMNAKDYMLTSAWMLPFKSDDIHCCKSTQHLLAGMLLDL